MTNPTEAVENARVALDAAIDAYDKSNKAEEKKHKREVEAAKRKIAKIDAVATTEKNRQLLLIQEAEAHLAVYAPATTPESTTSTTPVAPASQPSPPITEPAPPAPPEEPAQANNSTPPVQTTPTAVLEPQQALGLPAATVVKPRASRRWFDPRRYSVTEGIFAIGGILIGFATFMNTVHWFVDFFTVKGGWDVANHVSHYFSGLVWLIVVVGSGFFLGTWIGARLRNWIHIQNQRRHTDANTGTATPATTPASPVA